MAHRLLRADVDQVRFQSGRRCRLSACLVHSIHCAFVKASISMEEHLSRQQPAVSPTPDRLWAHLGGRIRLRREQIGMTGWTAANGLGVELQTYRDYEQGERLIPADQLAALAQLLDVPV